MSSSRDRGYATLAVTALMGALSVLAIAWLDRSATGSRHAILVRDSLSADAAIEGIFSEIIAGLVNRTISVGDSDVSLEQTYSGLTATVEIASMQDRTDLNRAPFDVIERKARDAGLSSQVIAELVEGVRTVRSQSETVIPRLEDIAVSETYQAALPCIRQIFTVFHNAAQPVSRQKSNTLPDGSLVRIHIANTGPPSRGLDAVILLTGSSSEPFWIFDWRRFSAPQKEVCNAHT